jgi:hypothetical protein
MPYENVELVQQDPVTAQGTSEFTFLFTGTGVPPKRLTRVFSEDVPNIEIRRWAIAQGQSRAGVETLIARIPVGTSMALTPIAPPTPTAEEVWRAKVKRYLAAKELALTNAGAISDRDALFVDINATYQSSYL